jgi:hypothetical protein
MKQIISLVFGLSFLCISSCTKTYTGEGEVVAESRDMGTFSSIALNMHVLLLVKDSTAHSCVVKAQQNLQEVIITRLDGKTLVITNKGRIDSDRPIVIEVTMNQAESFEVNGSGKIQSTGTIKNDLIDLEVNGSGSLEMDVVTDKLTAAVSGAGTLNLTGSTNDFDVEISGSGNVNAFDLNTLHSKSKISGSGEINVNVSDKLRAQVNGSGKIYYKGNPEKSIHIEGSGSVEKK